MSGIICGCLGPLQDKEDYREKYKITRTVMFILGSEQLCCVLSISEWHLGGLSLISTH